MLWTIIDFQSRFSVRLFYKSWVERKKKHSIFTYFFVYVCFPMWFFLFSFFCYQVLGLNSPIKKSLNKLIKKRSTNRCTSLNNLVYLPHTHTITQYFARNEMESIVTAFAFCLFPFLEPRTACEAARTNNETHFRPSTKIRKIPSSPIHGSCSGLKSSV